MALHFARWLTFATLIFSPIAARAQMPRTAPILTQPQVVPAAPIDPASPTGQPGYAAYPGSAPFAPSPSAAPAPTEEKASHWYGWETLLADGASLTILTAGGIMGMSRTTALSQGLTYGGLGGYALGGPAVHWGHGRVAEGFESLGLRLGLPTAAILTAYLIGPKCYRGDEGDNGSLACIPFILGGLVAATAAATSIDAAYLAREPVASTERPRAPTGSISFTPVLAGNRRGVVVQATF
jgi:hypothetical protein